MINELVSDLMARVAMIMSSNTGDSDNDGGYDDNNDEQVYCLQSQLV